jgi:hypothetical protein
MAKLAETVRSVKGVAGRTVARLMADLPEIVRSLFRAELALRRFLARFRGPVSAAHFGISGRPQAAKPRPGSIRLETVRSGDTPAAQASGCDPRAPEPDLPGDGVGGAPGLHGLEQPPTT